MSVIADVLDRAVDLSDRAESYPLWARVLFLVTLVLVLASLAVYAILFPRVSADDEGARPVRDPAPVKLLALLEKVAPRIRLYPLWAQRLFAVSMLSVAASAGTFVAVAPSAERRGAQADLLRAVAVDVGAVSTKAHRDTAVPAADRATGTSVFDAPLEYVVERRGATMAVFPTMDYLELVEHGGPLPSVRAYQWWDAAAVYPTLDVKVLNESERTVYVMAAEVVVDHSEQRPAPGARLRARRQEHGARLLHQERGYADEAGQARVRPRARKCASAVGPQIPACHRGRAARGVLAGDARRGAEA